PSRTSLSRPPCFSFTPPPSSEPPTLSLHDALPICAAVHRNQPHARGLGAARQLRRVDRAIVPTEPHLQCHRHFHSRYRRLDQFRSEEHTSELQSSCNLVCRLLLEKKKYIQLRSY